MTLTNLNHWVESSDALTWIVLIVGFILYTWIDNGIR
jgi:hypothetical protein